MMMMILQSYGDDAVLLDCVNHVGHYEDYHYYDGKRNVNNSRTCSWTE